MDNKKGVSQEFPLAICFQDRFDAGARLAARLVELGIEAGIVLGLPRGGIPVGIAVAKGLETRFDVFIARKLGAPSRPEFGIGAISEGGAHLLDRRSIAALRITQKQIEALLESEARRIEHYVELFRGGRSLPDVRGASVVVVDDGLATGVTMQAAVSAVRNLGAARIVVAVPVASTQGAATLEETADLVVALDLPPEFFAVGQFYVDFEQLPDSKLVRLLED